MKLPVCFSFVKTRIIVPRLWWSFQFVLVLSLIYKNAATVEFEKPSVSQCHGSWQASSNFSFCFKANSIDDYWLCSRTLLSSANQSDGYRGLFLQCCNPSRYSMSLCKPCTRDPVRSRASHSYHYTYSVILLTSKYI